MWYIYVLVNRKQNYKYTGITKNLGRRLKRHNAGGTRSTKPYRPFDQVIKLETVQTRKEARRQERYYKSGFGREKVNKMLQLLKEDSVGV